MKNLKDILEKLRVDDINLNGDFPIDGKLDDMIEFLENAGFKKVSNSTDWKKTFENYKKYNDKRFVVSKVPFMSIEIINRSNSKFKNKLFYIIKLNLEGKHEDKYNIFDDITTAIGILDARQVSKNKFLKELSEIL